MKMKMKWTPFLQQESSLFFPKKKLPSEPLGLPVLPIGVHVPMALPAKLLVQGVDELGFLRGELELGREREVVRDALGVQTLGDHADAAVHVPAEQHGRGIGLVLLCNGNDHGVREEPRLIRPEKGMKIPQIDRASVVHDIK
jgi:hypothetical protein